ncbi:MAG: hypothetical protein ACYC2H_10215 [Thermoplasmatota archaeon]
MTVKVCPTCRDAVLAEARRPKPWPLPAPPAEPASLSVWDLDEDSRVLLHETARLYLQTRIAAAGRLGGRDYKQLRKTTHDSDHGGSCTLRQLAAWGTEFGIPRADLEAGIAYVHGGAVKQGAMGPFPRPLTRSWAFLAGVYAGAGCLIDREDRLRLHVDQAAAVLVHEELAKIGLQATTAAYQQHATRTARATILLPRSVTPWFHQLGLPLQSPKKTSVGRGRTARIENLVVPAFVKATPQLRQAFVEGYLNTSAFQPYWTTASKDGVDRVNFHVDVVCPDQERRQAFVAFLVEVLGEHGVEDLRPRELANGRRTLVHGMGYQRFLALAQRFRLERERAYQALAVGGRRQ